MYEQRFLNACRLQEEGKFVEASKEFFQIAEFTADPLDKAGIMLQATHILATLGQLDTAESKLSAVRALIKEHTPANANEETAALELFLDFADANLSWLRDDNREAVLKKLEMALEKYTPTLKESPSRYSYEGLQIRRAFILADLGRWKEALPILEGITSPQEYREAVAFYLGHCYVSGNEYKKAKPYLLEALKLGLPPSLEYRAHYELGIVHFGLGGYAQAKIEFEKTLQSAEPTYLKDSQILKRLEICCRQLGLKTEAEHYARMAGGASLKQ